MTYYVYIIKLDTIRYVGMTNNIKTRQAQHRRDFKKQKKYLYKMMKENNYTEKDIILQPIFSSETKYIVARKECQLILNDYFNNKELWQSAPFSFKYY